jgi:hypothetical protein
MHTKSSTPANDRIEVRFPLHIFVTIILISLAIVIVVTYCFNLGYKMSAKFSPLVDAAMEIKLEATTAHLLFEEIINGDPNSKIQTVMQHIDNTIWYATAMLQGGKNPEGIFVPLSDPGMREDIEEVLKKTNTAKDLITEIFPLTQKPGGASPEDLKYDAVFDNLAIQADLVETKLQAAIASDLERYRYLQVILIASLIVLSIFLLFIFYRYESQRIKDLAVIRQARDQVKILSGLLPICASCKNIRDDKGYWNGLESYITDHSEAAFSHGICPECSKKLYPEIYQ